MKKNEINTEHLFNDTDLEVMSVILEKHSTCLKKIKRYKGLCSKLSSLTEIIDKKSKKISDLFDEYETTSMNIRNYELVLMYYLGFMKGLEAKKIK